MNFPKFTIENSFGNCIPYPSEDVLSTSRNSTSTATCGRGRASDANIICAAVIFVAWSRMITRCRVGSTLTRRISSVCCTAVMISCASCADSRSGISIAAVITGARSARFCAVSRTTSASLGFTGTTNEFVASSSARNASSKLASRHPEPERRSRLIIRLKDNLDPVRLRRPSQTSPAHHPSDRGFSFLRRDQPRRRQSHARLQNIRRVRPRHHAMVLLKSRICSASPAAPIPSSGSAAQTSAPRN